MITREVVIRNAEQYLNIQAWHPLSDLHVFNAANPNHTFYSAFEAYEEDPVSQVCRMNEYKVIPYVYGGFDTPTIFRGRINNQVSPGGWDKISGNGTKHWYDPTPRGLGYGASVPRNLTGIDCSGYVSRCWQITRRTTRTLPDICIQIDRSNLKKGDILNRAGRHVRIFYRSSGTRVDIYEATGGGARREFRPTDEFGCVVRRLLDWDNNYIPYSPFPQFIDFTPGATCPPVVENRRPTISITCVGSGQTEVRAMYLDCAAVRISPQPVPVRWRTATICGRKATFTPNHNLSFGRHRVDVIAINRVAETSFCDRFCWVFDVV